MNNPFARIHNEKWVYPVSAMSAVLGVMIVASWLTEKTRESRYNLLPADQRTRVSESVIDLNKYISLQQEVDKLRKRATELEKAISDDSRGSATLNAQLQEMKAFAGLSELEGPGVKIVLKDSTKNGVAVMDMDLIHDYDVLNVTNELFNAGAEAISVNGQRLQASSWIRCAGTTILIDDVKLAAPYVIQAIGDPDTLYNGFTIKGGIMTTFAENDPSMISITKEKQMRVPAYLGTTTRKFGNVPKVTK
jgi:uncharacterized protein YlxW (UPF0749 family)